MTSRELLMAFREQCNEFVASASAVLEPSVVRRLREIFPPPLGADAADGVRPKANTTLRRHCLMLPMGRHAGNRRRVGKRSVLAESADPQMGNTGTRMVVVTALRSEYAVLAGQVPGARVMRCGMGGARVQKWLPQLAEQAPETVVVAGVAAALDPSLRPGDVFVASEVRDSQGRIALRASAPLVAELRAAGMRVRTGPLLSHDHVIASAAERSALAATGAMVADMESAAIVRSLGTVPTAVVRVVVDTDYSLLPRLATIPAGIRALRRLRALAPALRCWADARGSRRVLLASPRSFCAGVERAIDIVEQTLQRYPRPVYVRRQIVHNAGVVADLQLRVRCSSTSLTRFPTALRSCSRLTASLPRSARRQHAGA